MGLLSDLPFLRLDPFKYPPVSMQIISQAEQGAGSEMLIVPTVCGHKENFKY